MIIIKRQFFHFFENNVFRRLNIVKNNVIARLIILFKQTSNNNKSLTLNFVKLQLYFVYTINFNAISQSFVTILIIKL